MEKILKRETVRADARLLALTGLFAALGCVGTMVLQVPSPTGGYMNLGDAAVLLGAYFLGPAYGALAGGVGPALRICWEDTPCTSRGRWPSRL